MNTELYETIVDFRKTSQNAIKNKWIISPLEYFWPDGKLLFDNIFKENNTVSLKIVTPLIYKNCMDCHFRANMIVLGFMKQPIAKKFSLEIENGLLNFYKLDFLSTISQWIYIIEGYMKIIFNVQNGQSSIDPDNWNIPETDDPHYDNIISNFTESLSLFSKNVLFCKNYDSNSIDLNRHLLLHGKISNKEFFSQSNALKLLFALDTLLAIEMVKKKVFPAVFSCTKQDTKMIENRKVIYQNELSLTMENHNLMKIQLLKEHLDV
jgi:hypothetical protein